MSGNEFVIVIDYAGPGEIFPAMAALLPTLAEKNSEHLSVMGAFHRYRESPQVLIWQSNLRTCSNPPLL